MAKSSIEWTDWTWNPISGCTILSPGCTNCYAMKQAFRNELMGQAKYAGTTRKSGDRIIWTGKLNFKESELEKPVNLKKPSIIFVNSMSDMFHADVPLEWQKKIFEVMNNTPRHVYQILTKRSDVLKGIANEFNWTPNIMMGVSVENADYTFRIDDLRDISVIKTKFLSLEPLLGPLRDLNLKNIDWLIAGGESGSGARMVRADLKKWVIDIRDQCIRTETPFHFKQWGGVWKKANGRELEGRTWDEFPQVMMRHRELYPQKIKTTNVDAPVASSDPLPDTPSKPSQMPVEAKAKDPARVAAAHRAWETMRARGATPNHRKPRTGT